MSVQSQEKNMRKLADLLSRDLGYIWGERERGPNGDKKVFLNTGKAFLRALAKDLGLKEYNVSTDPGGIAVSGNCSLIGMWDGGSTVRHIKDYTGGYNRFLHRRDLETMSYSDLLRVFMGEEGVLYGRAA